MVILIKKSQSENRRPELSNTTLIKRLNRGKDTKQAIWS